MGSAGICCTDGVLCTVLRACGKMEDGGRTARQVHAFAIEITGRDKQKMVVTLNQIHLYWEIDPSELDFSNKLCHDWDGKPLAIMALPAILNNSNNLELMWKSESEVFHIIESAITVAALRWPEKLLAQKQRIFRPYNMACRYSSTNDDGGYNSTAYNQEITKEEEEEPVYNQEITKEEEKPRRRIIRIKLVKDGKPTTATTVGSGTGATTVGSGMGANLKMASDVPWSNSEEYEKKLENSKRKLKEGYSKFEDSRKRSKVCMRILQRWDDALRAYTVKASQASSLHLVLEATLGLQAMNKRTTTRISMPSSPERSISCCSLLPTFTGCTFAICCKDCETLIEELSASHSSDLQQRAYELQAVLALDANAIKNIMPSDASCREIEDRLLDSISVVLAKSHYAQARQVVPVGRGGTTNAAQQISDLRGPALVQLALQTLARFNFKWRSFSLRLLQMQMLMSAILSQADCLSAVYAALNDEKLLGLISESLGVASSCIKDVVGEFYQNITVSYYPPCPRPDLTLDLQSHSDFGALTLLIQDQVSGLEIITNGNYRSAVHRAVTNSSMARLSVATFHDPAKTRNISPAPEIVSESSPQRYREVNYGYYMSRWYTKGPEGKRNIDSLLKLTLSSAVD
ncbi:Protein DMR6-LIKE OXYGENASE 2 [Linum grandiflorum]